MKDGEEEQIMPDNIPPDVRSYKRMAEAGPAPAVDNFPPPFSEDELRSALSLVHPQDEARSLTDVLCMGGMGQPSFWSKDLYLLVAMLSDAHYERIRMHFGWTAERMEAELVPIRADIAKFRNL